MPTPAKLARIRAARAAEGQPVAPGVDGEPLAPSPLSLSFLDSLQQRDEMLAEAGGRESAQSQSQSQSQSQRLAVSDRAQEQALEASLLSSLVVEAAQAAQPSKPAAPPLPGAPFSPVAAVSDSLSVPSTASFLPGAPLPPAGRLLYSPKAMVDLMIARPDYSHGMLCQHFGRPASWLPTVLASEAFQRALDGRRDEISDPSLTASLHERYKALAIRTSNVMMSKLDNPEATDFMVLKAGEIAFKALGMGQKQSAPEAPAPAAPAAPQESLAERLMRMMDEREGKRTINVEVEDITPDGDV